MTDQQKADYIKALIKERGSCEKRGLTDRVMDIDAELKKVGYEAKTPAKRAESRPRVTRTKKTETR